MTGGSVVVLGPTGRNFAAGMSGGRAFVLDIQHELVNTDMADIVAVPEDQKTILHDLVTSFYEETGSLIAAELLQDWDVSIVRFSMVMPRDYARVLEAMKRALQEGLPEDTYVMEVAHV
jgi:glutamate synthase (NADPH/NADH) large chain